jgi:hypothetical protein
LLLKIFEVGSTKLHAILKCTLCTSIIHGMASVLEVCLICRPLVAQWDPDVDGFCGNQMASFATIEISGLVLDAIILTSPISTVLALHIKLRQKVQVIIALDAGAM